MIAVRNLVIFVVVVGAVSFAFGTVVALILGGGR